MCKRPAQPDIPDRRSSVDDILAALGDESFDDYMQRQYDEGYARGYEMGLAMESKFVLDRAAEIWKHAESDPGDDFRVQHIANLKAVALREISREISKIKKK